MKRTRIARFGALLLLLSLVGGALTLWLVVAQLNRPVGPAHATSLRVTKGTTLRSVLNNLHGQGVLEKPEWLYYYARLHHTTDIRAGEYEIQATDTPISILKMLGEGRLRMETFTVPEGLDRWQVRDRLADAKWITVEQFDQLCDDPKFLAANDIPGPTCDGYLFPETYTFARGVPGKKVMAEMFATFRRVFAEVMSAPENPVKLSTQELVTLASVVEKETGAPEERPHIACVFFNRLRARPKWRLDTDPTVIYAAKLADPNFDGNLTRAHLRKLDSPYNTYRIYGLPPGPIASPGRAALRAVAHPIRCDDFFFVSKNNGRHEFCPTLTCHNRAVEKWQVKYFGRKNR